MLSRIVRSLLLRLDINKGMTFEAASLSAAIRRVVRRGMTFGTIIDVGASNGQWSKEVMRFFPSARYLLIEAQIAHRAALETFSAHRGNVEFVLKAAGEKPGTVYFDASDAFAGQATEVRDRAGLIEVPVTTIDHEVAARSLPRPYLIKFDVHGFELPILAGSRKTLENTDLIVMECYNFEIGAHALLFHDMCRHMAELGFRVIDFSEPLWRPRDEAFWQIDFFFVPATRKEFASQTYA